MKLPFFLFLFIVLASLSVPTVVAVEVTREDFTIAFNKNYDIKRFCFNNNTACSSAAVCNITIIQPSGNLLLDNALMTNQDTFHNITLISNQVDEFGDHLSVMTCDDTGGDLSGNGFDPFIIRVTGDGQRFDVFPIQIVFLIMGVFGIALGKWNDKLNFLKTMGALLVFVIGVVTLYPGYSGINFSTLTGQVMGFVSIGSGFWFMIEDTVSHDRQVETFDQHDDGRFTGND